MIFDDKAFIELFRRAMTDWPRRGYWRIRRIDLERLLRLADSNQPGGGK